MNKENTIDIVDESNTKENQILFELPPKGCTAPLLDEYQAMIKDLILMALPGPSQQVH